MNVICGKCGGPIPRQKGPGGQRKFCPTCSPKRDRPDRQRKRPTPKTLNLTPGKIQQGNRGNLTDSTTAELTRTGVLDTWQGQAALILAHRIDAGDEPGGALSQLVKAHRDIMAEALAQAKRDEPNLLEQLRAKRADQQGYGD